MKSISSILLQLFLLPIKFPLHLVFSRKFSDKVLFYSFQPTDISLESSPLLEATVNSRQTGIADATYVSNGGGFLGRSGRLLVESGGLGGGTQEDELGYQLSAGSGQGGVNLGFILKGGSGLRIYPMVGIGGHGGGLLIRDDSGEAIINSGLADVIYNTALGIDFKIGWRVGFIIGARIGVTSPLNSHERKPFTRFVIGFGVFE